MKKIIILILILNLTLALTQVLLSAKRATDGADLAKINNQIDAVRMENDRLKTNIYQLSALEQVQQKATSLQLSRVTTKFVNLELPVARAN